ncbi:hypothetical protein CVT25_013688 [Psilocybe cyanescens]|uniref:Retrovirus-related Pol polyprotein from transposon TNT 1-94-like beta-barrel domain-containing protein n=1 Tax=Psilocybe cyanescens TaxID=93625 RepID=A0A409XBB5_PSICY|nr:hypothetical protein CVT25_013688 [Psilocybe cyanescens]
MVYTLSPAPHTGLPTTAQITRSYEICLEKWQIAEATVKQCIASTVPDSIFNRIKSKKTAKDIWDTIADIFETCSTMVAIDLRLKLQNVKCGDAEDVHTHFDKLADMKECLASCGVDLEDHEYASILIGSLPSIYNSTLSSILASAKLRKTTLDPDTMTMEFEHLPESFHIPDTDPLNADRLHSIMLTRNVDHAHIAIYEDSMSELQSVTATSISSDESYLTSYNNVDSMPDLESIARNSDDGESSCEDDSDLEEAEKTMFASVALIGTLETRKAESDLYDSGASCHMTPFKNRLLNFTNIASQPITAADKRVFHATGKGDLCIKIPNGTTTTTILLRDVLYAPNMGVTIVSISHIATAGYSTLFCSNFCRIFDNKQTRIGHIHVTLNGLYCVDHEESVSSAATPTTQVTLLEMHQRMGHISQDAVKKLGEIDDISNPHVVKPPSELTSQSPSPTPPPPTPPPAEPRRSGHIINNPDY